MALSDDIWWTRKARIQAEKRLLSYAFQSQLILLWYSFFGVAVSIYYLKFSNDHDLAGVTWVIYSVLSLCISGFLTGLSFKERASLIKECYETLKGILQQAKLIEKEGNNQSSDKMREVHVEYSRVLSLCENHTDIDMTNALCLEYLNSHEKLNTETGLKDNFTKGPTEYQWKQYRRNIRKNRVVIFLLYTLPFAIFLVLEVLNESVR